MPHEHGSHLCYCPSCNYQTEVNEYVRCNTLSCPVCGARLRAVETGERRISKVAEVAEDVIAIDDQPMDATFFGEVRRLTDFITPDALEVEELFKRITSGIADPMSRLSACHQWVASRVKYVNFVSGRLTINGRTSVQNDLWTLPETTINTQIGNCAVKSFLLTSLVRNELPPDEVYCTLGNLYNGKPGGHAWVTIRLSGEEYIMESTTRTAPPLVPANTAKRYEAVHYFNDSEVLAVEGRTQLVPMAACYSTWLSDYLNWAYIESQRQ